MNKQVDHYVLEQEVGRGAFAQVYRGYDLRSAPGQQVAIKVVAVEQVETNPKLYEFIHQEIEVLKTLSHPNIVSFLEVLKTCNHYYLVYEYADRGCLESFMQEARQVGDHEVGWVVEQLIKAFLYLQSKGIIHRDIKAQNILVTSCPTSPQGVKLMLADFGFSRHLGSSMASSQLGTPLYMCPEMLKHQEYDYRCDVWSMGVMLYQLVERRPLFSSPSISHLIMVIEAGMQQRIHFQSPHLSPPFQHFIIDCLQVSNRPDWHQLHSTYQTQLKTHSNTPMVHHALSLLHQYLDMQQQKRLFIIKTLQNSSDPQTNQLLATIAHDLSSKLLHNMKHNLNNILSILLTNEPRQLSKEEVHHLRESYEFRQWLWIMETQREQQESQSIDYQWAIRKVKALGREGRSREALNILVSIQVGLGSEDTQLLQQLSKLDGQTVKSLLQSNLIQMGWL